MSSVISWLLLHIILIFTTEHIQVELWLILCLKKKICIVFYFIEWKGCWKSFFRDRNMRWTRSIVQNMWDDFGYRKRVISIWERISTLVDGKYGNELLADQSTKIHRKLVDALHVSHKEQWKRSKKSTNEQTIGKNFIMSL